jgi:tripartite-type tricarboxylate transporter receptor subunit TctC
MNHERLRISAVAGALALCVSISGACADDYYKGKTLRIVVGTPTGGGYDTYARLVGRHIAGFIPGKPAVIVSNLPGASGTKAATYLYSIAPKDGTVIATFNKSMPAYQALGHTGAQFKTEQMAWIGSLAQTADVLAVWHTTGVKTIDDAKTRVVVMGADSSGGTMSAYPLLLNATIGTRFKVVTGYSGTSTVDLAMEKGEVDGRGSNPWISYKATKPTWVKDKLIVPLVQVGFKKEPDLPDVPLLIDLAENDEQRAMFRFVSAPVNMERPYAGPPDMAAEPLAILRRAFAAMVKDKSFLAEAARLNLDINPHRGREVAATVAEIVNTPQPILQKLKSIIGGK